MTSYQELIKQRDALEQQINEARTREQSEAVAKVRAVITEFGLKASDVFPAGAGRGRGRGRPPGTLAGSKVAPKYRHPETGATWTGRGKAPRWIADQDRSKFAI